MDALGLRRVRLVGHDWGAHAAFRLALQAPARVSHLPAVNAPHPWSQQRRLLPQLWRFWYTAFWEYPRIRRLVLPNWPGLTRFLLLHGAGGGGGVAVRGDGRVRRRQPPAEQRPGR